MSNTDAGVSTQSHQGWSEEVTCLVSGSLSAFWVSGMDPFTVSAFQNIEMSGECMLLGFCLVTTKIWSDRH